MHDSIVLSELSRELLRKGNSVRFQAKGWSMHPFIQDGDFITVVPIENSSIKTGDVVLYSPDGNRIIVHRVVKRYKKDINRSMLVKGDALGGAPEKIDIQNVLGKVVSVERGEHRISLDRGLNRVISFSYRWPLIKILRLPGRVFGLFDPNLFIKKTMDSFQSVAEKYNSKEEVESHSKIISEGLEEWEKSIVRFMKPEANILDVGCGAGREAIALTKMGFKVTGIDISPNMIAQAAENAQKEGLDIDFIARNVSDIVYPVKSFDYVLFSRAVYSHIPTKKLRVETLKKIRGILKSDGMLFFSAYCNGDKRLFSRLNIIGFFRRLRNFFLKEKFDSEPGDVLISSVSPESDPNKLCFCHIFSSPKEILEEIIAAGMTVFEVKNTWLWIVNP
jgi:ubiquinone/menaquinone biosynthesis C-methylase UbiE/signal peptidase I